MIQIYKNETVDYFAYDITKLFFNGLLFLRFSVMFSDDMRSKKYFKRTSKTDFRVSESETRNFRFNLR